MMTMEKNARGVFCVFFQQEAAKEVSDWLVGSGVFKRSRAGSGWLASIARHTNVPGGEGQSPKFFNFPHHSEVADVQPGAVLGGGGSLKKKNNSH